MGKTDDSSPPPGTGVFRSEEMNLCHLFLQPSIVFDVTCVLGDLGIVEFRDLNAGINSFQRTYVDEVRRVEEVDRKLVYLNEQLLREETITLNKPTGDPPVPRFREIIRVENNIDELDRNLRDVNNHLETLRLKQMEFTEMNHVLLKTHRALEFTRSDAGRSSSILGGGDFLGSEEQQAQLAQFQQAFGKNTSHQLHNITGVIRTDRSNSFRTMIWRVCGQNALVQFFDIETPIDDVKAEELVTKKAFLIMAQGDQLHNKLMKICEGFRATIYQVPADSADFREVSVYVESSMKDLKVVIEQTLKQKYRMLMAMSQADKLASWQIQVAKLKAVFATMNLYRKTEKGFIGECWAAATDHNKLKAKIDQIAQKSGVQGQAVVEIIPTTMTRPTYYRLNKFTSGFQGIVDSYGVSRYREMNPAPYTIISFPFLFAVMFADAGHGFIMLLFALWMVLFERRLKGASNNEIWLTFFDGRYIILLMGCFSMYTGLIYNDVFAKSVNFFGSAWMPPPPAIVHNGTQTHKLFIESTRFLDKSATVYPYGVDPIWQLSTNKIIFLNSFKMKLSVVLGVMQMLFGVILSLFNHLNFKSAISIFFEFIPQLIFLLSLFGYLITLIFAKWLIVWEPPSNAPFILIDFINMFLQKYPTEPTYLAPWFAHKQLIQTTLLLLALGSVPIMLLVKPSILVCCNPNKKKSRKPIKDLESNGVNHQQSSSKESHDEQGGEHEESTGDIYIHQAIHTIEYCLGSISHTASYLRLWALSLAHSQLSDVLWSMIFRKGLSMEFGSGSSARYIGAVVLFLVFAVWAALTVSILILMEGLSAFLHAIRLHWVEFQSKFYLGDGYAFQPFSFAKLLAERPE